MSAGCVGLWAVILYWQSTPTFHVENSREIKLNTHTHIFSCFLGSISMETSREASHQNTVEVCRLSGYLGLGWISVALREGYTLKGDPPGSFPVSLLHTHTHTHTCLLGIPLHFQALFCLESGGSKEVHSSHCSEWSHIGRATGVYDPSNLVWKTLLFPLGGKTPAQIDLTYSIAESLFSVFLLKHSLISSSVKFEATVHLRLAQEGGYQRTINNTSSTY